MTQKINRHVYSDIEITEDGVYLACLMIGDDDDGYVLVSINGVSPFLRVENVVTFYTLNRIKELRTGERIVIKRKLETME
jgi:hypothetical protein